MLSPDFLSFMSAICLFAAIIGAMLLIVVPKSDEGRRGLGIALFCVGMGGLAFFFVLGNPEVLKSAQEHIALTLIGMVIAFFSFLRMFKK